MTKFSGECVIRPTAMRSLRFPFLLSGPPPSDRIGKGGVVNEEGRKEGKLHAHDTEYLCEKAIAL